ncbi:hypothetical protein [Pantoea sp.]|uniref:hypothetical protein n=1 Tax=Pantoea sp. TaxID=69393 RepID=UPI0031D5C951
MKLTNLFTIIALAMPLYSTAAVETNTTSSMMANVVFSGCEAAATGKPDSAAIDYWIKGASQYGKNPSFDKMYKQMIENSVLKGSHFHRENSSLDCVQIYINVIDSLYNENEVLKKRATN